MKRTISILVFLISISASSNIFTNDNSTPPQAIHHEETKNNNEEESSSISNKLKSAAYNVADAATQAAKNVAAGAKKVATKTKNMAKNTVNKIKEASKTVSKKVKKTIHTTADRVKSATEETPEKLTHRKQETLEIVTILSWMKDDKTITTTIINATVAAGTEGSVYFCPKSKIDEVVKDKKITAQETVVGIPNHLWNITQSSCITVPANTISFNILNDISCGEKSLLKKTLVDE